ncbi:hypothetical protein [Niveispirillum sp. BGYR6]|uniref:hypothetical protein n=1 Tax=Niveispirillum sp. BGYR6 TaxID=2971249 RepID=UPI0022B9A010|nr:hypothetical protein [Niveispirillum sp. BGYR6]MDG5497858.1 hypothetical protein [Niveispirillum sp. BGYR6]
MPPLDEQSDLNLVEGYLTTKGLIASRFSLAETQRGKTPDFRVTRGNELVAYCEVKSPNDPWLDVLLDEAVPGSIVGGLRDDPIFNRLARLLMKAVEQFEAVNPERTAFNILAYVNHDKACGFDSLRETVTGYFHAESGGQYATMLQLAEGRLREPKRKVDAILWFEAKERRMVSAMINDSDEEREQQVRILLGLLKK